VNRTVNSVCTVLCRISGDMIRLPSARRTAVATVARFAPRPAPFCTLPVVREHTITAPKWPRGDAHTDGFLGTLDELLCDVGARVREDETVAVIETDKISVDVRAPVAGVIVAVLATAGESVDENQPIYMLREEAVGAGGGADRTHTDTRDWAHCRAERLEQEEEAQARLWESQKLRMKPDWQWRRSHFSQYTSGGDAPGSQRRTTQRERLQWQQWQKRQQRMYESARPRVHLWEFHQQKHNTSSAAPSRASAPRGGASNASNPVARVLSAVSHYEVLGLARSAGAAEVKRAFNRLAMQVRCCICLFDVNWVVKHRREPGE